MKYIWSWFDNQNWHSETKFRLFPWAISIPAGALGFIVWALVQARGLQSLVWMVCFIGYPVIISWAIAAIYACNHDFYKR